VCLNNVTAVNLSSTNTTVVRTLRTGETTLGPSVRLTVLVEEGVLLLKTEPGLLVLVGLHELGALVAVVELVRGTVGVPALSQDEKVVATAEWIGEGGHGTEVDIGVLARSLSGGRSVEVPFWKVLDRFWLLVESLLKVEKSL
jgi:hypothetical protein